MSKERITCRTHCPTWNSVDKDCEIYGIYHPTPRKCPYFLMNNSEYREKFKIVSDFIVSNGLDKHKSRREDFIDKLSEVQDEVEMV